jgi:outer membrane receptor for ferrienterochelin and colicins
MTQNFLMSIVLLACVAPAIQAADFNNNTLKGNIKNDKETVLYDSLTLDQVVVTATHTPKALKDVPVVTRLISLDDIKKTDATNIQDLLVQELPGLEFGFAMSQETSLNMSGFGGNAVLFLVDGERVAGETVDNTDYNRLNLDNVGRIEIVKGASSALYGSNAVGGVINIITRESSDPWTANVNSRYSSFGNEWRNGAGFSFNSGKWNSQTNFQHTDIEPIKLASGPTSEEKALAALLGQTIEEDKSNVKKLYGQESYNVKERITFTASDFLRFIARGGYFYRESQRDTYNYHFNAYSGGLKAIYDWRNGRNIEVSYAYDQYDKANFTPEGNRTHDHDYRNAQHTAHAVYNHTIGEHVVTLGSDLLHDYLSTYQFLDNTSHEQNNIDAYAQLDFNPSKRFNVVGSVRYDYFSASGADALTARLAAVCKLDGITLRANYASGFRAPSLKEMYMHFDMGNMGYIIMGNPDVKPEKSNNFNVAIELGGKVGNSSSLDGKYNITLMGYCNIFDKRITSVGRYWVVDASHKEGGYQVLSDDKRISEVGEGYVFTADDGTKYEALTSSLYWNEDGVKVFGLDLSAQYRFDFGLALRYNYAYMHERGNVIDTQFSQPRTHSMTWRIDYDHRYSRNYAIGASLSGRYLGKPQSGRKDVDQGYTLWKLMFQQHILKGIHLNLAIDNILNYKPKAYYYCSPMTTGTTYSVGLSVDIDRL